MQAAITKGDEITMVMSWNEYVLLKSKGGIFDGF